MRITPIYQKDANAFVFKEHRHHDPVVGSIFQIGLSVGKELVGVAICGRPVGPKIDHKRTIEVNRLCVKEGISNGCSKLYGTCARIAKEMGYEIIITYILESEPGTSLKASGWINEGLAGGRKWNSSGTRIRTNTVTTLFGTITKAPEERKNRWVKMLQGEYRPHAWSIETKLLTNQTVITP